MGLWACRILVMFLDVLWHMFQIDNWEHPMAEPGGSGGGHEEKG